MLARYGHLGEVLLLMREPIYSLAGKRVWVAGHRGMVGQALLRRLAAEGCEILAMDRASVDLRRQATARTSPCTRSRTTPWRAM